MRNLVGIKGLKRRNPAYQAGGIGDKKFSQRLNHSENMTGS